MENMMPKSLKETWWLIPACIVAMTLGIFIMAIYFFPGFAPEMHERMIHKGLNVVAPLIGGFSILAPVATLWYHCRAGISRGGEGGQ